MGKGSNTSTTTQNNAPPPQFLDAYSQVMNRATNVANQPLQQYPGTPQSLVAGFSPDQQAAFANIEGSQGIADPYINSAAQFMQQAGQPLQTQNFTNYLTQAAGPNVSNMANAGASGITGAVQSGQGMLSNAAQQGMGGILGASTAFQPGQIGQWMSPYTQNVVDTTQAQFNNQNQQQMNQLQGNAASQGALGSDRLGVAQGILANQQQLAQAPQIANLYQQGYTNAEQQALAQAQMGLTGATAAGQLGAGMAQAGAQLGLQGAQGAGAMGLQGATTQAQLESGAAQQLLGANEAQGWLNSQLGYGMANLGQEAQSTNLAGANALLGIGGMQQQLGQEYLNIPYEQFVAQQSYPFQSTGWLANIAEGLGSQAGGMGTGTATSPGPSALSQIGGLGLAGVGLLGATGAFGSSGGGGGGGGGSGWLSNLFSGGGGGAVDTGTWDQARGGRVTGFAGGGGINMSPDPTAGMRNMGLGAGLTIAPDVSLSIVPQGASPLHGTQDILKNYGSTSTSTGSGGGASQAIGDIGTIASVAKLAALAFANKGGRVPHFAAGGTPAGPPTVTMQPASYAGGVSVPQLSRTAATTGSSGGTSSGGGFNDYLNGVLGQIPTAAQLAATKPQAAPAPSATPPPSFSGNASLSPQQQAWAATLPFSDALATLGGVPTMSQSFAGQSLPTFGGGFGGGGGGEAGPVGGSAGNQAAAGVGTSNVGGVGANAANAAAGANTSDVSDDANAGFKSRGGALGRGIGRFAAGGDAGDDDATDASSVLQNLAAAAPARPPIITPPVSQTRHGREQIPDSGWTWGDVGQGVMGWLKADPGNQMPAHLRDPMPRPPPVASTPSGFGRPLQKEPIGAGIGEGPSYDDPTQPPSAADLVRHGPIPTNKPDTYTPTDADEMANWGMLGLRGPSEPDRPFTVMPNPSVTAPIGAGGIGGHKTTDGPRPPVSEPTGADERFSPAAPGAAPPFVGATSSVESDARALSDRVSSAKDALSSRSSSSGLGGPWGTLLAAGLGIMGGTSKFPGVNIGRGALQGLQFGEKQREAQATEDLRAQQAQDLAEYRKAQLPIQAQRAAAYSGLNDAKIAAMNYRIQNPNATLADLQKTAIQTFQSTINPATGQNYTAGEAYDHVKGMDWKWANLAETTAHHGATEATATANLNLRIQQMLESNEARAAQQRLGADNNTMNVAARNMNTAALSGKPLTWDDAIAQVRGSRAVPSNPAPASPAPAASAAKPLPQADLAELQKRINSGSLSRDAAIAAAKAQGFDASGLQAAP